MKIKIIYTLIIFVTSFAGALFGQQTQPFTQYLFNRFMLNPAACGADGYSSFGLTIKDQWTGFGESPFTQSMTGQIRVPREGLFGRGTGYATGAKGYSPENVGLGIVLTNDMRGPIRTSGTQFVYAYHLETKEGQLSFGLGLSLFQLYINRNKIRTELEYDHFLDASNLSSFIPDASFGLHYTTRDYYAGISASNLFQSYLTLGGRNSTYHRLERYYMFLGGAIFELANRHWTFVPSAQFRLYERGIGQVDINSLIYYQNLFWGGFSYRLGAKDYVNSASLIFGMRYNNYYFGYAFDYSFSSIQKYTYGTHELMLTITLDRVERFFRYARRYEFQDSEQVWRRMRSHRRGMIYGN